MQGIGCTKISKAKNEGSLTGNSESRSYLEKKLVFCFGSYVSSQLLLPFGEENFLCSSELKQAQEVSVMQLIASIDSIIHLRMYALLSYLQTVTDSYTDGDSVWMGP